MRILSKNQHKILEKALDERAEILMNKAADSNIVNYHFPPSNSTRALKRDVLNFKLRMLWLKICALEGVKPRHNRGQKIMKINDFYKYISPENYKKDMVGGLMGAEEVLFRLRNRRRLGVFPGNDIEFKASINRARAKIKDYIRRIDFSEQFIGKDVTAYDIRMAGG